MKIVIEIDSKCLEMQRVFFFITFSSYLLICGWSSHIKSFINSIVGGYYYCALVPPVVVSVAKLL